MRLLVLCLCSVLTLGPAPAIAEDSSNLKIKLQASMQRHIDRNLVEGAMLMVDFTSGGLTKYYPTKAHPTVLAGDGYFVLCADVWSADGASVPVDYYLVETQRGFKVIRTEVSNRGPLMAMMKAGDVRRF
ncbi:MAG: hypothetical protein AAF317_14795 [Pseudomonadota bacterium]